MYFSYSFQLYVHTIVYFLYFVNYVFCYIKCIKISPYLQIFFWKCWIQFLCWFSFSFYHKPLNLQFSTNGSSTNMNVGVMFNSSTLHKFPNFFTTYLLVIIITCMACISHYVSKVSLGSWYLYYWLTGMWQLWHKWPPICKYGGP